MAYSSEGYILSQTKCFNDVIYGAGLADKKLVTTQLGVIKLRTTDGILSDSTYHSLGFGFTESWV